MSEIATRIVPKHLRWPESGTSIAWTKAHDCVDALQDFVRKVDRDCTRAEENKELSATAIRRRRAELCEQALRKLTDFRPFDIAEKALIESLNALGRLSAPDAQQSRIQEALTKALTDLREGIEATRRMVLERCKVRERVSA